MRYDGTEEIGPPSEAELLSTLESMASGDAEGVLSALASALFPTGTGDLAQITWPESHTTNNVRTRHRAWDPEAKLRTAELRYRTLIEQIPAVTFMAVLGEGDNEVYVSPHIEALLGFTQAEWLENPFLWYTQLHPEDRDLWHREFARGCRTGGPFRADCRFIARDGRVVWVHGEARLVKDEIGRPLFLQGVAFDITEAKRAEELLLRQAVQTTEERYRDLVEQLGAIFWEAEADSPEFTFVSVGAQRILGYPPERWIADPGFWLTRVHPDDRAQAAAAWERARRSGSDDFEFRAITADERVIWLHQKVYVHRQPTGGRRLLGVVLDITDRKRAEEILRANEARLRTEASIRRTLHRIGSALASELDLDRIVQLATDEATSLTTAEVGAFFYNAVNERGEPYAMYALSGASKAHLPDPPAGAAGAAGPVFRDATTIRLDDLARNPQLRSTGLPAGLPVRSYLAVPVVSRAGEVLGGLAFAHSHPGIFTEEHEQLAEGIAGWTALAIDNARLYLSAERARQTAEAANRAKDEFLATMSHELRTPLNAILGWTMILRTTGGDDAVRQRALDTIERNARAQVQIIEDLLDVSRIVTGKLRLDVAAVDLVSVIASVLDSVRLAAEAKRIRVEQQIDPHASAVIGDANRLHQVVSNLLTNAVKFTPPGGWIQVGLQRAGDMARLTVSDNGQGISPEFLPYVFDRFRQADGSTTRAHGGLGLGLAIVRHLVNLHGGTVLADSAGPDRGATFIVEIPLMRHEPESRADYLTSLPWSREQRPLEGVRVLVVDDDVDSRDLMGEFLLGAGAEVASAASAADALALVDRFAPHVLVSDVGMPHQDGYDLLRVLRGRNTASASIPAIAVTAYARPDDRERALAAGFQVHVAKPVAPRELIASVQRLAATRT